MRKPFTRLYQPKTLDDFHYDDDLVLLLKGMIAMDRLNLLLIGNPGSGKTATLQAIIREYYGNNDYKDNILHINTLKEQGISYYRNEVKIFCQTGSAIPGKKKIILIDDADVINEQSQQVFRNCIDKYSHNVAFMASCCNSQKVIESIQSRVDIIKLKPPTPTQLMLIANHIIDCESITLDDEVLGYIVRVCNGSTRILINFLEKFKLIGRQITLDMASSACTNIAHSDFVEYTNLCKSSDGLHKAIEIVNGFILKGYSVTDVLESYFSFIKLSDILSEQEKYAIIPLICKYITVFYNIHEDDIELKFFTNELISALSVK